MELAAVKVQLTPEGDHQGLGPPEAVPLPGEELHRVVASGEGQKPYRATVRRGENVAPL